MKAKGQESRMNVARRTQEKGQLDTGEASHGMILEGVAWESRQEEEACA